jgi:hypothetical protein
MVGNTGAGLRRLLGRGQSAREGGATRNEAGVSAGHWRGSKKGDGRVGGRRGREIQRRARVTTA